MPAMDIYGMFYLVLSLAAITTTVISIHGGKCSRFDLCQAKHHERTCSCADDCLDFGNCCKDFPKLSSTLFKQSFYCYSQRTSKPVYAKRSCADGYLGHTGIVAACLEEDIDDMDLDNNRIVTSHKSKITYWNLHCALCNNEIEEDLEFWNIDVFCPAKNGVDKNLIRRNLTYFQDLKDWGFDIGGEFVKCVVKYAPPYYVDETSHCTPNLISSCPKDYENQDIVEKCSKYYGERKLKKSNKHFKNVYCAICNGFDLKYLTCSGMSQPEETDHGKIIEVFTKGRWLDKERKTFECSKGFLYDPFWKKCRRYEFNKPLPVIDVNSAQSCNLEFLSLFAILFLFLW